MLPKSETTIPSYPESLGIIFKSHPGPIDPRTLTLLKVADVKLKEELSKPLILSAEEAAESIKNHFGKSLAVLAYCAACLAFCSGCVATHTIVLDRNADWVMTADDVYGSYLIRTNGVWVKQKGKLHYPEGWIAGPIPK